MGWARLALGLVLLGSPSSRALAQQTILLMPGDAEQSEWDRAAAQALAVEGVVGLEAGSSDCRGAACAAAVAVERGARLVVLVDFRRTGAGRPKEVVVTLVRPDGERAQRSAKPLGGGVSQAVLRAYRDARLQLRLGQQSLLKVASRPSGATVYVDGSVGGHTPLDHVTSPGRHQVEVRGDGFRPSARAVQTDPGAALSLTLTLERELSRDVVHVEPSPLNWIVGGTLVAGAVPALAVALNTAFRQGDCVGMIDAEGRCQRQVDFGARSAVLLGVGVVALLGGGFVLIAQPFEVEVQAGTDHALVQLRGSM